MPWPAIVVSLAPAVVVVSLTASTEWDPGFALFVIIGGRFRLAGDFNDRGWTGSAAYAMASALINRADEAANRETVLAKMSATIVPRHH